MVHFHDIGPLLHRVLNAHIPEEALTTRDIALDGLVDRRRNRDRRVLPRQRHARVGICAVLTFRAEVVQLDGMSEIPLFVMVMAPDTWTGCSVLAASCAEAGRVRPPT